jgi:DNA invertase Pin-like site-specific DNA recombinase
MSKTAKNGKAAKRAVGTVKHAAIYVRVSSEKQAKTKGGDGQEAEEKESPQAQERDCRALAERQGYVVAKVYRDTEKYRVGKKMVEPSGTRADRPGLRAMLADARRGDFEVILAWREDRLYRSYRPMLDVLDCIEETGVDVELAKEHFDKTMAPVKAWAARMELQAKHDRLIMAGAGKLASGKTFNLITPYGYRLFDGKFEVVPDEAKWIQKIWEWYSNGEKVTEIRRRLVTVGATQKFGGDKHVWGLGQLRHTLKYDCYHTGIFKVTWDGKTYELSIPVIVDAEIARLVLKRQATYKAYPAGNLKAQVLAAGLVYCEQCKVMMSLTSKRRHGCTYTYYYCNGCKRRAGFSKRVDGCAGYGRVEIVDGWVWGKVWDEISDPVKFEARVRAALAEKQAQEVDAAAVCKDLEDKLDALAFERQKVVTWARKGVIGDDDLGTQLAALTFEEAGLRRELADKRVLVGDRAERFIAFAMDFRERLVKGAQVNFDPQTPAEVKALFEYKRWVVQGVVKRVDVRADKTTAVHIEFDDQMLDGDPVGLPIMQSSACRD